MSRPGDDVQVRWDRHRLREPRTFARELDRPHLGPLASRALEHAAVLVQAEAGYGKTAFARRLSVSQPTAWYCLEESDNDSQRFAAHLVAALDRTFPGVESAERGQGPSGWLDALDDLIDRLEVNLPEHAALVIDDLHAVHDDQTLGVVSYFAERLPAPLTLILTSQTTPALPGLHRWHAEGRLFTVGREHLRFRADEVIPFFKARYDRGLSESEAARVHQYCEGWPIAMHLLGSALTTPGGAGADAVSKLLITDSGRDELDRYLDQHVLSRHEPDTREFLIATSLVDHVDQDLADALMERPTGQLLTTIATSGLYLASDGHGVYRYQGWFRDFLRARVPPGQAGDIHLRAARHLERRGQLEDAAEQFLAAGDAESAARALDSVGPALVQQGQHMRLLALSDRVPPLVRQRHHNLSLARSDALRFACRFEDAVSEARSAAARPAEFPSPDATFAALDRVAQVHLDTVRPSHADGVLSEMATLLPHLGPVHEARWEQLAAENALNAGNLETAAVTLSGRDSSRDALLDARLAARLEARRGNLSAALSRLNLTPLDRGARAPRAHREKDAVLAWVLALRGDGGRAEHHALRGMETGRTLASPIIECVCAGRAGLARLCLLGDPATAVEVLQRSLDIADSIDLPRFRAEALIGLTVAHGRAGRWSDAHQVGTEALAVLTAAGDRYLAGMAQLTLGVAAVTTAHPDAEAWLMHAQETSEAVGEHYIGTLATIWLAHSSAARGDRDTAGAHARKALHDMREHAMDFLLTAAPWAGLASPHDRSAIARLGTHDPGLAAYAQYLCDANATGDVRPLQRSEPWGVQVHILGDFSVHVDGHLVPEAAWRRRKARELFWLLCARPSHSITRAEAADLLWSEGTVDPSSVRFRVALHALREAVEPNRAPGSARFVHSNDERLWLDPLVSVDTDAFRDAATKAARTNASPEWVRDAVALYAGPLLPTASGLDWVEPLRQELSELWSGLALAVATEEITAGHTAVAIPLLRRIIATDPYDESAQRLLATALVSAGQPGAARVLHGECSRRFADELGVDVTWTLGDVGL